MTGRTRRKEKGTPRGDTWESVQLELSQDQSDDGILLQELDIYSSRSSVCGGPDRNYLRVCELFARFCDLAARRGGAVCELLCVLPVS